MGVIPFNSYTQASDIMAGQGSIGSYNNLSLALQENPQWTVIDGGKTITNPVEAGADTVVPISNYIQTEPALEGGMVGATEAVELTETGAAVTATSSGLFAGWTVGTAVAGILAGLGVGIAAFDLAPEFWTGLSNKLFGTDIAYEDIKDYRITGLIKDELLSGVHQNTTYLPYNTVQSIMEYCAEYGLFNESVDVHFEHEYEAGTYYECTLGSILDAVDDMFDKFRAINPMLASNEALLRTVGRIPLLKNLIESNITDDNICQVYVGFGYIGLETSTIYIDVYTGTVSTPFTHRVNTVGTSYGMPYITFSDLTTLQSSHHFRLQTFYRADPSMDQLTIESNQNYDLFIGYQGYNWDERRPTTVRGTNIDKDYEYVMPPGIYTLPDQPTVYDPSQPFAQQYPDWYQRLINTNGLQLPYDDPALYPIPWLPAVMPDYDPLTQPEQYPDPATHPETSPYPATNPQPWAEQAKMPEKIPDPYPDPNPAPDSTKNPQTGADQPVDDGAPTTPTPTPPIVFPTVGGEANALFTVYNPTLAQLNSLAGVLWTSNFLDNLMKIFTNNPMDAVISLHMLFTSPTVGNSKEIILGCYPTGVSALEVTKQYHAIDCGTVRIPEYFGDVRDYINTVVDVYLPFVGMRHLKTQDIIGSNVTIKACVDVFTGTILYTINIKKKSGINQVMYAFEGNCAVQLPLTGADRSRMFSVLGAAATGAAVGGVAGAVGGAAMSAMQGSTQADIQRSGNFGSNAGAMGVKKPYIVVSRNIGYDANNYNKFHGLPANVTVKLGQCSGYTKVLDCHLTNIDRATDSELQEIERLLKTGVIL